MLWKFALAVAVFCALGNTAYACPQRNRIVDANCDGVVRIVFIGDSVVFGVGDSDRGEVGGYVARLQERLPRISVYGYGVSGAPTMRIYADLVQAFARQEGDLYDNLQEADYVIIDAGRNDRWQTNQTPANAVRNLERMATLLTENLRGGPREVPPVVYLSVLLPTDRATPKRQYQQPFIDEINRLLLLGKGSYLIGPRYDRQPATLLTPDGIHPSSFGYGVISFVVRQFLQRDVRSFLLGLGTYRDRDRDNIYDFFERELGCLRGQQDSDDDGVHDGVQVFREKRPCQER